MAIFVRKDPKLNADKEETPSKLSDLLDQCGDDDDEADDDERKVFFPKNNNIIFFWGSAVFFNLFILMAVFHDIVEISAKGLLCLLLCSALWMLIYR